MKEDDFLVMARGAADELIAAKKIFKAASPAYLNEFGGVKPVLVGDPPEAPRDEFWNAMIL